MWSVSRQTRPDPAVSTRDPLSVPAPAFSQPEKGLNSFSHLAFCVVALSAGTQRVMLASFEATRPPQTYCAQVYWSGNLTHSGGNG